MTGRNIIQPEGAITPRTHPRPRLPRLTNWLAFIRHHTLFSRAAGLSQCFLGVGSRHDDRFYLARYVEPAFLGRLGFLLVLRLSVRALIGVEVFPLLGLGDEERAGDLYSAERYQWIVDTKEHLPWWFSFACSFLSLSISMGQTWWMRQGSRGRTFWCTRSEPDILMSSRDERGEEQEVTKARA